MTDDGLEFAVEGAEDAQITVQLADEALYQVLVDGVDAGVMKTNMGGKLNFSVELNEGTSVRVKIVRK